MVSMNQPPLVAADRSGQTVNVDRGYVDEHLGEIAQDEDLARYIL